MHTQIAPSKVLNIQGKSKKGQKSTANQLIHNAKGPNSTKEFQGILKGMTNVKQLNQAQQGKIDAVLQKDPQLIQKNISLDGKQNLQNKVILNNNVKQKANAFALAQKTKLPQNNQLQKNITPEQLKLSNKNFLNKKAKATVENIPHAHSHGQKQGLIQGQQAHTHNQLNKKTELSNLIKQQASVIKGNTKAAGQTDHQLNQIPQEGKKLNRNQIDLLAGRKGMFLKQEDLVTRGNTNKQAVNELANIAVDSNKTAKLPMQNFISTGDHLKLKEFSTKNKAAKQPFLNETKMNNPLNGLENITVRTKSAKTPNAVNKLLKTKMSNNSNLGTKASSKKQEAEIIDLNEWKPMTERASKNNSQQTSVNDMKGSFNLNKLSGNNQNIDNIAKQISNYLDYQKINNQEEVKINISDKDFGHMTLKVKKRAGNQIEIRFVDMSENAHNAIKDKQIQLSNRLADSGVKVSDIKFEMATADNGKNMSDGQKDSESSSFAQNKNQSYNKKGDAKDSESQRRKELWELFKQNKAS